MRAVAPLDVDDAPRLIDGCAELLRAREQQRVEPLAPERAAPGRSVPEPRQVRVQLVVAGVQTYALERRAGQRAKLVADAERVEQREVRRRDAFAADLAPRERALLDERDGPARGREQDRSGRSRDAAADPERDVTPIPRASRRRDG